VDFSSVGQVVGHRNCQPLFFVLAVKALAMAYVRFGRGSDVYVYEQAHSLVCLVCKLNESGTTITTTRSEMLRHMEEHRRAGIEFPSAFSICCALTWPKMGM
jgi:hypothetical protein